MLRNRSSFTLIELLLATMLSVLVGAAVVSTFAAGLKAYHRVQGYGRGQADILLSLEKMEKDLRNAFAFSAIGFEGDSHQVSFAGFVPVSAQGLPAGEYIGQITYVFDGSSGNLSRQQKAYLQNTPSDTQLMASVKDLSLSYGSLNLVTQEYSWQDSWSSAGTPQAVKITVTLKGEDEDIQLNRTVFLPLAPSISQD